MSINKYSKANIIIDTLKVKVGYVVYMRVLKMHVVSFALLQYNYFIFLHNGIALTREIINIKWPDNRRCFQIYKIHILPLYLGREKLPGFCNDVPFVWYRFFIADEIFIPLHDARWSTSLPSRHLVFSSVTGEKISFII